MRPDGNRACQAAVLALFVAGCSGTVSTHNAPSADASDGAVGTDGASDTRPADATSEPVTEPSEPVDAGQVDAPAETSPAVDTGADDDGAAIGPDGCPIPEQASTDSCEGFALGKACSYANDPLYGDVTCTCTLDGAGPIWICTLAGTQQTVCPDHPLPEPCSDYKVFFGCLRKGSVDVYCVCASYGWSCYA